ncbi:hypothetical protein CRYUN_Cryun36dG0095400 [Craigia yunnanensis]
MASHRVHNQNDRLANVAAEGFHLLDEMRPRPSRRAGMVGAPPQYPPELPYYQQPWMGFGNQVVYPRDQRYVITSTEAAQIYSGALLNDLPK